MKFTQLRFLCRKKIPGRTFHIVTKRNSQGKIAVEFLTARNNSNPRACESFSTMGDDNSFLGKNSSKWGYIPGKNQIDRWSFDPSPGNDRLVNHMSFIWLKAHWIIDKDGRWECDDFKHNKGAVQYAISAGDLWKIYVR